MFMNFIEYQISKIMLENVRRGTCAEFLGRDNEATLIRLNTVNTLLASLKEFRENSEIQDKSFYADAYYNLEKSAKAAKEYERSFMSNEEMYKRMLALADSLKETTKLCADTVFKDWKLHLSSVDNFDEKEFSFIVRAVKPVGYKNERDYPIISASLFTGTHDCLYNNRNIAFIIEPDEDKLIMMSRKDSGTAKNERATMFEVPFSSRCFALTDTFNPSDKFEFYHQYLAGVQGTGEILFDSTVKVNGVIITSCATLAQKKFAESYACVYDLPLFLYNFDDKTLTRVS